MDNLFFIKIFFFVFVVFVLSEKQNRPGCEESVQKGSVVAGLAHGAKQWILCGIDPFSETGGVNRDTALTQATSISHERLFGVGTEANVAGGHLVFGLTSVTGPSSISF